MENWKPIVGFDKYEVSDRGRVRSYYDTVPRVLAQHVHKQTGYVRVNLIANKNKKHRKVHRLVALAFLPNPNSLPEVNHKDGNKLNCDVENLEWTTPSGNIRHAIAMGRHHMLKHKGKYTVNRGLCTQEVTGYK